MKKIKLSSVTCLQILCLAGWAATAARAEDSKTGFDQGSPADGAIEMARTSAQASVGRFSVLSEAQRRNPGINLVTLKSKDKSLVAVFRDSRVNSTDQAGGEVIIQAEISSAGPAGVVRTTRELKLKKSETYEIDFSSLDIGQEVLIRHRYKSVSGVPRFIPAHDYSTCNGPSCFSCTHEEKCVLKTVRVCGKVNPITLMCDFEYEKIWDCSPGPGHVCSPK
jgi:hypothetical protein